MNKHLYVRVGVAVIIVGALSYLIYRSLAGGAIPPPPPPSYESNGASAQVQDLGAGRELVKTNFAAGIQLNGGVSYFAGSFGVKAATSSAFFRNMTGQTIYVEPSSILGRWIDPLTGRATTSTSTLHMVLATSTTPVISDYIHPAIQDTLLGTSTISTSTAGYPNFQVFSPSGMPTVGFSTNYLSGVSGMPGGHASSTSKHASSTVAIRDGDYLLLLNYPAFSICGGPQGSAVDDGLINYGKQCESASSSPAKPHVIFRYFTIP